MNFLSLWIVLIPVIRNGFTDDDIPNTTVFPTSTLRRIRNHRLSMLRSYVLESLGFSSPPRITHRQNVMAVLNAYQNRRIVQSRCYLPSCSISNRINLTMWMDTNANEMNLYFDVITSDVNSDEQIINATLKLRVKPRPVCLDCGVEQGDERFIVTPYQYVKPLRRKRKTRMMDVKMIRWSESTSWLAFDVIEAARDWLSESKKNNGIAIKIQTMTGVINITEVFSPNDCAAHTDIDCSIVDTPFHFQGTPNAILEIFTEKNIFR